MVYRLTSWKSQTMMKCLVKICNLIPQVVLNSLEIVNSGVIKKIEGIFKSNTLTPYEGKFMNNVIQQKYFSHGRSMEGGLCELHQEDGLTLLAMEGVWKASYNFCFELYVPFVLGYEFSIQCSNNRWRGTNRSKILQWYQYYNSCPKRLACVFKSL